MKVCGRCKQTKEDSEYSVDRSRRKPRLHWCCKQCDRELSKQRYTPAPPRDLTCIRCGSAFQGVGQRRYCDDCRAPKDYAGELRFTQGRLDLPVWRGGATQRARLSLKPLVDTGGAVCSICGRPIAPGTFWDLNHVVPVDTDPARATDPGNWAPSHRRCNRSAGAVYGNAKRRALSAMARGRS